MRQLPNVPAGMRLFLWVGESSVSEWTVPIVAQDEEWAAEAAIRERVRCGNTRGQAEQCFEDDDRLIDITDLGDVVFACDPPAPVCSGCDARGELLDGLCCDCCRNRQSANA